MKLANRYELIKEIGSGGMANVYLALDTVLNREVAIKILKGDSSNDPIALERFKREANTSTRLSHPNAVDIYDVGDDGDSHYIVMEYVKGHTLKQLLKRRGPIPYKEAVWIMKQLSGALLEAHKNGIIHRDIKSQNVLIKDDGTVKLTDFGIAILNNALQLTSHGNVLGSVHYLAPELCKGSKATMQSDIYSLGILFYELLTGDVPYKAESPIQIALLHVKNTVPYIRDSNRDIPQAVENIIIKSTAKSLDNRYSNIALVLRDLNRCLQDEAKNDERIIFNDDIDTSVENIKISNTVKKDKKKKKKEKEKKEESRFNAIFIAILSIVSIIAIVIILFLTGIIGSNNDNYVIIPDIKGKSINEARDILSKYDLLIDEADIEWTLTDDVAKNQIVSYEPNVNETVLKGTKIKLVVSEGIYSTMLDYVGMNIYEVKETLKNMNFNVIANSVESDKNAGTIITQEGFVLGQKYNPNVRNTVYFTYAASKSFTIDYSILGRDIDLVLNEYTYAGYKVEKKIIDKASLNDEQIAYGAYNVVKSEPECGSLYTQNEDSKIILYYFEGE